VLTPTGILRYRLANTEFVVSASGEGSTASVFRVTKSAEAVTSLPRLRRLLLFRNVLQLVGDDLGSVALTILVGSPTRIVAVSTDGGSTEALLEFAARRGMTDRVSVHQGVSMDDHERLSRIVAEFDLLGGVEVVIDDVSDRLVSGLGLFDTLFPQLGARATYVLERWSFDHFVLEGYLAALDPAEPERIDDLRAEGLEKTRTTKGQVLEAILPMLVRALRARPDIVAGLEVSQQAIAVTRGPAAIEHPFRLSDIAQLPGDSVRSP
jgi:hypothetical protein